MIDILLKINEGKLSVDQAYEIMEELINEYHDGNIEGEINTILGLDRFEWTALGHALDLSTLSSWRKYGWPNKCCVCNSKIDYQEFGWTIKNSKLKCLKC